MQMPVGEECRALGGTGPLFVDRLGDQFLDADQHDAGRQAVQCLHREEAGTPSPSGQTSG